MICQSMAIIKRISQRPQKYSPGVLKDVALKDWLCVALKDWLRVALKGSLRVG